MFSYLQYEHEKGWKLESEWLGKKVVSGMNFLAPFFCRFIYFSIF